MRIANGFTLIELMIVVAIVATLTLVAVPMYTYSVRSSVRAEARGTMYELSHLQERYFTTNNSYLCFNSTGCSSTPTGWKNYSGSSYASRKYSIGVASRGTVSCSGDTITNSIANGYVITATPANGFSDPNCGVLTLDSCGTRTNSIGLLSDCWK